jgi:hypothetical protein
MTMKKSLLMACACSFPLSALAADQSAIHVEPSNLHGPRPLEKQTETAAIRDYLQAWEAMREALEQDHPDLLDADFVGTAKDKLAGAIQEQARLGVRTLYQDRAHDIKITFYSPDGLSIQLVDKADYDVQILDHDKVEGSGQVRAHYIVVLTPSEVRWRVRVLQADPQ